MKEQMTEKKKLEDVTEVQMKYQKEIEAIVRGMSSPKVMRDRLLDYHENGFEEQRWRGDERESKGHWVDGIEWRRRK